MQSMTTWQPISLGPTRLVVRSRVTPRLQQSMENEQWCEEVTPHPGLTWCFSPYSWCCSLEHHCCEPDGWWVSSRYQLTVFEVPLIFSLTSLILSLWSFHWSSHWLGLTWCFSPDSWCRSLEHLCCEPDSRWVSSLSLLSSLSLTFSLIFTLIWSSLSPSLWSYHWPSRWSSPGTSAGLAACDISMTHLTRSESTSAHDLVWVCDCEVSSCRTVWAAEGEDQTRRTVWAVTEKWRNVQENVFGWDSVVQIQTEIQNTENTVKIWFQEK